MVTKGHQSNRSRDSGQGEKNEETSTEQPDQSRPDVRNRATGSAIAIASRRKNQRATAKPNAA